MSSLYAAPRPSNNARMLANTITGATDVQRQILMETVESAQQGNILESGRTFCPENAGMVRGPLGRFPRAVDLQSCPVGSAGIIHTHVSTSQLRNPTHSLPDTANVILGEVDASMVLGTTSSDLLLAPDDPEEATAVFQDALGLGVNTTDELVSAIESGQIPNPPEARRRVRTRLSSLFTTVRSPHRDIDFKVNQLGSEGAIPARRPVLASCHTHTRVYDSVGGHNRSISECCDDIRSGFQAQESVLVHEAQSLANIDWTNVVATAAVSSVVSAVVSRRF